MTHKTPIHSLHNHEAGIHRALNTGIFSQVFHGEQSTTMIARFEPNAKGRLHKHPHEQWHFVLEGSCIRVHGDEEIVCKQGDFWVTLGNTMHTVYALEEGLVLLDVFAPARDDYRVAGSGFGDADYQTPTA